MRRSRRTARRSDRGWLARRRRRRPGRGPRRSRSTWSSPRRGTRRRSAATSCARAGTPSTRRSRRPSPWRSRTRRPGTSAAAGSWSPSRRAARGRHVRLPRDGPEAATPRMYLGPDGKLLPRSPRRGPRGGRAGDRPRARPGARTLGRLAWADLVRPAARLAREGFPVSGDARPLAQRPAVRPARRRDVARDDLGREPRPPRRLPRVGRRLPQGRRHPLARRRPARPARPGRHPRPDRRGGARRVLQRQDRRPDRRLHGRPRRPDHAATTSPPTRPASARRSTPRSAASTSTAWARRPRGGSSSA